MPNSRDPLSQRMYYLLALSEATNCCEVQACESAIRVLEWHYPWLKTVTYIEPAREPEHMEIN